MIMTSHSDPCFTPFRHRRLPTHVVLVAFVVCVSLALLSCDSNTYSAYLLRNKLFAHHNIRITLQPPSSALPSHLKSYIRWHKQQYHCLKTSECPRPALLIWRCKDNDPFICAGIGDRFRGIQFSFLLAVATRRLFLIDWPPHPFPLYEALLPVSLNWLSPIPLNHSYPLLDWFACEKRKKCTENGHMPNPIDLPNVDHVSGDIDLSTDDVPSILKSYQNLVISTRFRPATMRLFQTNKFLNSVLPGVFEKGELIALQRLIIQSLFRPTRQVLQSLPKQMNEQASFYGMHVRVGTDLGETKGPRFIFANNNERLVAKRLIDCLQVMYTDAKVLFLASDSSEMRRLIVDIGRERGISVLVIEQKALHFGLQKQMILFGNAMKYDSFLKVFVDMVGLSRAKAVIGTRSGFARSAILMGNSKQLTDLDLSRPIKVCPTVGWL